MQRNDTQKTAPASGLNSAQADLLRLISSAGAAGCLVYGRPYAATAEALLSRGLIRRLDLVEVVSMGVRETRQRWVAVLPGSLMLGGKKGGAS